VQPPPHAQSHQPAGEKESGGGFRHGYRDDAGLVDADLFELEPKDIHLEFDIPV
jgi:hypothetical protein